METKKTKWLNAQRDIRWAGSGPSYYDRFQASPTTRRDKRTHAAIKAEFWHKQRGECVICGKYLQTVTKAQLDHDHETGKFRGLLCHTCNLGLGAFKDSRKLLLFAEEYLEAHGKPLDLPS